MTKGETPIRMIAEAIGLARYGTKEELRAFVRESLPGASEDLVQAIAEGHVRHAHDEADTQ